jgi:hypothetical protein
VGASSYQQAAQAAMDLVKASAIRSHGAPGEQQPAGEGAHAAAGAAGAAPQQHAPGSSSSSSSSSAAAPWQAEAARQDGAVRLAAYIFPQTVQQQAQQLPVQQLQQLRPSFASPTVALPVRAAAAGASPAAAAPPSPAAAAPAPADAAPAAQPPPAEPRPAAHTRQAGDTAAAAAASRAAAVAAARAQAQEQQLLAREQAEARRAAAALNAAPVAVAATAAMADAPRPVMRERAVPSTSIGRALGFAGAPLLPPLLLLLLPLLLPPLDGCGQPSPGTCPPLARPESPARLPSPLAAAPCAGMGATLILGSLSDSVSRAISGPRQPEASSSNSSDSGSSGSSKGALYSNFITEQNAERLANALCRMRGAALKLGQMLSIQDEDMMPPQVGAVRCVLALWRRPCGGVLALWWGAGAGAGGGCEGMVPPEVAGLHCIATLSCASRRRKVQVQRCTPRRLQLRTAGWRWRSVPWRWRSDVLPAPPPRAGAEGAGARAPGRRRHAAAPAGAAARRGAGPWLGGAAAGV